MFVSYLALFCFLVVSSASAFLLRAVDCLRRGVGSLRLQPCSEVAVRLTTLMLFHSLYAA